MTPDELYALSRDEQREYLQSQLRVPRGTSVTRGGGVFPRADGDAERTYQGKYSWRDHAISDLKGGGWSS